jgi:ABC-2 type transport system permease protein
VLSAFSCFLLYIGFDFIASLFPQAETQDLVSQFGIAAHYDSRSRGVLDLRDVCYFVVVSGVIIAFTFKKQWNWKDMLVLPGALLLIFLSHWIIVRFDLTTEKRYTLSDQTKQLLRDQTQELKIKVYLDGDLNMGFLQLKKATKEMLQEMDIYAAEGIEVVFENPSEAESQQEREKKYEQLANMGLMPVPVMERDAEGNMQQKIVFPWAVISLGDKSMPVMLLKNGFRSGEENLNISIENLEYELTDAIRILSAKEMQKIAFLDGHNELSGLYIADITQKLAKYYKVERVSLNDNINALDAYKVVIVAEPYTMFSELDKFILDQYIMNGGSVMWMVDGVMTNGEVIKPHELNLTDQLFTYGVRISPTLLLDVQCALKPIQLEGQMGQNDFEPAPWYYSPLLTPLSSHSITRNLSPIKADFVSYIEWVGAEQNKGIKKTTLLTSSEHTAKATAPMPMIMDIVEMPPTSPYFSERNLPVAALLEGEFMSLYAHRMTPKNIDTKGKSIKKSSKPTKMIVVADGSIIANEVHANAPMPLGYDAYMNQQFGNGNFVLNAINYLAGDEQWLELRNRQLTLRLLDKVKVAEQRLKWQLINMLVPLLLLITFSAVYQLVRRKHYVK